MKKYLLAAITAAIVLPFIFNNCTLQNCLQFNLLEGRAQQPSNIYLLFSVETCSGNPKAGLQAEDFEIYEDGEFISIFESDQTILPRPQLYTLATVLLLDMSGSILESETLNPLKLSAKSFVSQVAGENGQEVAIYLFDGRERIKELIAFTEDVNDLQNALDSLLKEEIMNDPEYDISTNLNGAVIQGVSILDDKKLDTEKGKLFSGTLITFTDGTDRAHRFSDGDALHAVKSSVHSSFTIGLGGEIDDRHLASLGKSGFAWAENASDLENAFNQIAEQVKNESDKFYVVGYCTPSRKGNHHVTLKVTGYSGSLSYAFNSDGFEGGCNPEDIVLTTTTTIRERPCFIEELYGEDSAEAKLLRYFRDTVLASTLVGNEIINQYDQWSPVMVNAMTNDEELKEQLIEIIHGMLVLIEAEVEQDI